jgi:hypothetical protein
VVGVAVFQPAGDPVEIYPRAEFEGREESVLEEIELVDIELCGGTGCPADASRS